MPRMHDVPRPVPPADAPGSSAATLRVATRDDLEAAIEVRGACRENAVPRERLAALGITAASMGEAMAAGHFRMWVVSLDGRVVAFSGADRREGEVQVVAVRDGFEGRGFGRRLLAAAVDWLQAEGCPRIWLMAAGEPSWRAHGFYRALGWVPTGRRDDFGDDEMEWRG